MKTLKTLSAVAVMAVLSNNVIAANHGDTATITYDAGVDLVCGVSVERAVGAPSIQWGASLMDPFGTNEDVIADDGYTISLVNNGGQDNPTLKVNNITGKPTMINNGNEAPIEFVLFDGAGSSNPLNYYDAINDGETESEISIGKEYTNTELFVAVASASKAESINGTSTELSATLELICE